MGPCTMLPSRYSQREEKQLAHSRESNLGDQVNIDAFNMPETIVEVETIIRGLSTSEPEPLNPIAKLETVFGPRTTISISSCCTLDVTL
jgi:hypothetical protein